MLATLIVGAVAAQSMTQVSGSVTYRERMALPPDAVMVVRLDRYVGSEQTTVSELTMKLGGKQVPVRFTMPYLRPPRKTGEKFGLTAVISAGGQRMFESPSATMVVTNGKTSAELRLVRATAGAMWPLEGPTWELMAMDGKRTEAERKPTITFEKGGRFGSFAGVNRLSGIWSRTAPWAQIDPGPMTLMAGPPELMQLEQQYVKALELTNRLTIEEGELVLWRGENELMRFKRTAATAD
ncbi:MAG: YbaY family lipoprotein [Fimbriimonadaceae bacterium]|nr:YbaY family lipoprotein [Fimbriimonadaceae bacterium]QYK57906.1 MAG: YbaY family lipoprotein [Fimbriimonadaceae bacterium]